MKPSQMQPGDQLVLSDGRSLHMDEYGGFHLAGDPDIGVTNLDDPSWVERFQHSNNIRATGRVDNETRDALRRRINP